MQVTLYTTDKEANEIIKVRISHVSMFGKNEMQLTFTNVEEQLKFIKACVEHYVLIQVQGIHIKLIPEPNNFVRIHWRFDNDTK